MVDATNSARSRPARSAALDQRVRRRTHGGDGGPAPSTPVSRVRGGGHPRPLALRAHGRQICLAWRRLPTAAAAGGAALLLRAGAVSPGDLTEHLPTVVTRLRSSERAADRGTAASGRASRRGGPGVACSWPSACTGRPRHAGRQPGHPAAGHPTCPAGILPSGHAARASVGSRSVNARGGLARRRRQPPRKRRASRARRPGNPRPRPPGRHPRRARSRRSAGAAGPRPRRPGRVHGSRYFPARGSRRASKRSWHWRSVSSSSPAPAPKKRRRPPNAKATHSPRPTPRWGRPRSSCAPATSMPP